ncbi:MAG: helix-turn-helix domain-containing protein [Actinomycetota bacterium]|nr:helix-turn-helix domain-containing protein [Actinomycetota bacterium]
MSQAALAVRAGTSQSYVSRVEQGDVAPSLERAARLLRCLGHELDLEARPMSMRDPEGLPESLAMTRRERMVAMAELHNGIAALQEGRRAG